tara:strand:+ start:625 stop:1569 length:945 start_codon:yes stop_codon:yes gene_type:complete
MKTDLLFDPIQSKTLLGLNNFLLEFTDLYNKNMLPKISLINGKKGIGKCTMINHFLNYIFSKDMTDQYDLDNFTIKDESIIYKQIINGSFQNVIYLNLHEGDNIKIDDVRNLKDLLLKSTLNNKPRFVVINEVEYLNINSINALLKVIEEPSDNNYFILINNNQAELIETLSSRCLKTNIFLNEDERINTIKSLIDLHDLEPVIDYQKSDLTPGLFLRYNFFCTNNNLLINNDIESKISILLNYYKKNKDLTAINLLIFFIEEYFYQLSIENNSKIFSIVAIKNNIIRNINNFVKYNLNINSINNLINTEFKNV